MPPESPPVSLGSWAPGLPEKGEGEGPEQNEGLLAVGVS